MPEYRICNDGTERYAIKFYIRMTKEEHHFLLNLARRHKMKLSLFLRWYADKCVQRAAAGRWPQRLDYVIDNLGPPTRYD